jgi:phosphate-selective porin OprO/OprP
MAIGIVPTKLTIISLLLAVIFRLLFSYDCSLADTSSPKIDLPFYEQFQEKAKTGIHDPLGGHYYWYGGFHLESPKERLKINLNGRLMVDGGYIGADETLQEAFPDFQGGSASFRELRVILTGTAYDHIAFKSEMDFANVRDIKDIWIGYTKAPFFGDIKVGHFKEPVSLEQLTSTKYISFMERALPIEAMSPGRNIGIMCNNIIFDDRMTWAAGAFLVTGSFSDVGDFTDQLSEAFGRSLTARVTGIPRYANNGRTLLHLGFSYSHQFRDNERAESNMKLRTHPESRIPNEVLVNTGEFPTNGVNLFNGELAMVSGPFSFQGEYSHALTDASTVGNPRFWGFYGYASYFLTGEHRNYDRSLGVFSGITPKHDFYLFEEGWGAWELAFRFSYVDLNDKGINGGKERNFTFGTNWYLNKKSRFMFNYIHATVKDRADPTVDKGRANIFQMRFQIAL